MNIFTIYDIIVYLYMYQQLYVLSNCLCKETNKNINNYSIIQFNNSLHWVGLGWGAEIGKLTDVILECSLMF